MVHFPVFVMPGSGVCFGADAGCTTFDLIEVGVSIEPPALPVAFAGFDTWVSIVDPGVNPFLPAG